MIKARSRRKNGYLTSAKNNHGCLENQGYQEELRRRAEATLFTEPASNEQMSDEEIQGPIHELLTHQRELEMQNKELPHTYAALEAVRDRYYDLFNLAPVGYLVLSGNGVILEANLASANLLGVEHGRLKNLALTGFIFRDDQDIFYLYRKQDLRVSSRRELVLRMVRNDCKLIWVQMECLRIEDLSLPASEIRVVLHDITEEKQLEQTLRTHMERLAITNGNLESFATVAAHDLQEPLRKIKGFGDLLANGYGLSLDVKGRDYIDRMQKAAARMELLINNLMMLSRVTTQAMALEEVDLNQCLQEVLDDLDFQIKHKNGQVEIGNLPRLVAEPTLIRQLFRNLIGNALKYHQPEIPPRIQIEAEQITSEMVELRVRDNGIGFDPAAGAKIFEPFVRLHGRNEYVGTGIGLAICRKVVEHHRGQIFATSRPMEGATFVVQLPLRQP